MQRRRSRGWWGVFLCAFLAMGVYIAFELLDLDGSDLRHRLFGNTIAAEPAHSEAERLLHQATSTADAQELVSLSLGLPSVSESPQATPRTTPATFAARLAQIRPRAHVGRETPSGTSPTDDPA